MILIKPSHYDEDGYVIQWSRSSCPSNSLAAIYALARDSAERRVLGEDVCIRVVAHDETNTRIRVDRLVGQIRRSGGRALVALVGVQSNQFPRAVDLAIQFLDRGVPVCIGGFHVSGCIAMLDTLPSDLREAMDRGISLFAGELEGRMDRLLADAWRGELKPLYDFMAELPDLESQPVPYLPADLIRRMSGRRTSFDAGRGCPFQCSFCTIINVQGRKSRHRSPDDVERIVRENVAQGIHKFFVTDDNFSRNRAWESILDRLIHLREVEGLDFNLMLQVDTQCHRIPHFIEKAGRAGVYRVFIGLENINPEALAGSQKGQNQITEYRTMLQAWHGIGALTMAGYILGFPADTPESIRRDIRIIQRELPVDFLEFFILTPLPGSQDHRDLLDRGAPLESDMNRYDTFHVATEHPLMTAEAWQEAYRTAWDEYYTPEHIETMMRRARQWRFSPRKVLWMVFSFYGAPRIEGIHPLDSGLLRRKVRRDRRRGLPLEGRWRFYTRYARETAQKAGAFARLWWQLEQAYRRAMRGAADGAGDLAMAPVESAELEALEIFTVTRAARNAASKAARRAARSELRQSGTPGPFA